MIYNTPNISPQLSITPTQINSIINNLRPFFLNCLSTPHPSPTAPPRDTTQPCAQPAQARVPDAGKTTTEPESLSFFRPAPNPHRRAAVAPRSVSTPRSAGGVGSPG